VRLQTQLAAEQSKSTAEQAQSSDLRTSLDMSLQDCQDMIADLRVQLTAEKSQSSDLRAQLATAKAQLGAAQLDMVAADAQLNDAQDEIVRLQTQLANANKPSANGHGPLIKQMKQEIELGLDQLASLQSENSKLQAQLASQDNGLSEDFDFGRRVYQCVVPNPGVGYRHTPQFADKNKDGTGPQDPQVIIADRICQGPSAVFIRCTSGNGWLPISTPDGKQQILKHVGKESAINMDDFQKTDGKSKLQSKRKVEWYQKSSRGGSGRNSGNRTPNGSSRSPGDSSPRNSTRQDAMISPKDHALKSSAFS